MVTLIILFYLLVGVYTGMRRGLTLELVYIAGYFITFLVAMFTYTKDSRSSYRCTSHIHHTFLEIT